MKCRIFAAATAAKDAEHRTGVEAARHHRRNEVGRQPLHDLVAGREAGEEVPAGGARGSAATKAPGTMLVPGWVSMRKESSLPPAIAISALAKAAPPFVTLVPCTMMVAPWRTPSFFFGDELHGLLAAR